MLLAVDRFRAKMESSNWQFLRNLIDKIEVMSLSIEEEKINEMSLYWPDFGDKGKDRWNDGPPPGPVLRSRETRNTTRLEDALTIYHEHMDGIFPPFLVADEWRQMYLETVKSVCNEVVAHNKEDEDEDFDIPMCRPLRQIRKRRQRPQLSPPRYL